MRIVEDMQLELNNLVVKMVINIIIQELLEEHLNSMHCQNNNNDEFLFYHKVLHYNFLNPNL